MRVGAKAKLEEQTEEMTALRRENAQLKRAASERAQKGALAMREQAAEELRHQRYKEYRSQLSRVAHGALSDRIKAANLSVAEARARAGAAERKVGATARSMEHLSTEVEQLKA